MTMESTECRRNPNRLERGSVASNLIAFGALVVSAGALVISARSCTIAEEQAVRYFDQIVFDAALGEEDTLRVFQVSGSTYF